MGNVIIETDLCVDSRMHRRNTDHFLNVEGISYCARRWYGPTCAKAEAF